MQSNLKTLTNNLFNKEIITNIIELLENQKAEEICALDVSDVVDYTDFIIICNANSSTHLKAIVRHVQTLLDEQKFVPLNGTKKDTSGKWIILDYGDFILHVMESTTRKYYNLEEIYKDATILPSRSI